jgi:hypothetical protein
MAQVTIALPHAAAVTVALVIAVPLIEGMASWRIMMGSANPPTITPLGISVSIKRQH